MSSTFSVQNAIKGSSVPGTKVVSGRLVLPIAATKSLASRQLISTETAETVCASNRVITTSNMLKLLWLHRHVHANKITAC